MYTPRKQSKKHGSVSAAKLHGSRCSIRGAPPVKVGEGLADGVAATGVSADRSVVDVQTSIDQGGDDGGKSGGDVVVEAPVVFMDDNAQYGVRKGSTEVAGKPQELWKILITLWYPRPSTPKKLDIPPSIGDHMSEHAQHHHERYCSSHHPCSQTSLST